MLVRRITIIGLGLIGGSLGRALVAKGYEVTAIDNDPATLDLGLKLAAATRVSADITVGLQDAQVIFLAVPVGEAAKILEVISPHLRAGTIVTDVGSVKDGLMKLARKLLPPGVEFIGGHPMAGKELTGVAGADPLLFDNAFYVLTPGASCSQHAVEVIGDLVRDLGAHPIIMDSVKHDRAVAVLSHLPHLLAVALAHTAGDLELKQPGSISLAAGSFRDGTRVAESSPKMWQDICKANREHILASLATFRQHLDLLESGVKEEDGTLIANAFHHAAMVRQLLKQQVKGRELTEVAVSIPDKPGSLGTLAKALGEANINIVDIEILHSRDDLPGSVILGFQDQAAAAKAITVLDSLNIAVQNLVKGVSDGHSS